MITESDLMGNWKSIREIPPLKHNSNFSNWIGASACSGYILLRIEVENNKTMMHVGIPVAEYGKEDSNDHFAIYSGRLEINETEILIWQNEKVPSKIPHEFSGGLLKLTLFGTVVDFLKENRLPFV